MKHHMYKNKNKEIKGMWRWEVHNYMACMSVVIFAKLGRTCDHRVIFVQQGRDKRKVKRQLRKAGWIK